MLALRSYPLFSAHLDFTASTYLNLADQRFLCYGSSTVKKKKEENPHNEKPAEERLAFYTEFVIRRHKNREWLKPTKCQLIRGGVVVE